MTGVRAPADRRFRRVHVKPGRKRGQIAAVLRPALKVLAVGALAAFALYRGGSVVAHAGVLKIDDIVVRGNGRLSNNQVLATLGGLRGENIVLTDLDAWRRRLMASPWIRDASLRRL